MGCSYGFEFVSSLSKLFEQSIRESFHREILRLAIHLGGVKQGWIFRMGVL